MCKLDSIIQTKQHHIDVAHSDNKGMSPERIRYNTDLVFSVAKEKGIPLDEVLCRINSGETKALFDRAFETRKKIPFNVQVSRISATI